MDDKDNQVISLDGQQVNEKALVGLQFGLGLDLNQVKWVGEVMNKSGLFGTDGASAAIVKVMAGQELGMPPFTAMQAIQIVRGHISMSGNSIASRIKQSGKYEYILIENSDKICTIDFYQVINGQMKKVGAYSHTIEMAKRAGLVKPDSNWEKYPEAMLFNRAISAGQKKFAPDVFQIAVYTPDEAREIDESEEAQSFGYIPSATAKKKKGGSSADPITKGDGGNDRSVVGGTPKKADTENETTDEEADALDAAAPDAPAVEPDTGDEPVDEIVDEDTDRTIVSAAKKPVVDDEFKQGVNASLSALALKPQERMRLLKDSTGQVTAKNLDDEQWRAFANAIDEYAIKMGDQIADSDA